MVCGPTFLICVKTVRNVTIAIAFGNDRLDGCRRDSRSCFLSRGAMGVHSSRPRWGVLESPALGPFIKCLMLVTRYDTPTPAGQFLPGLVGSSVSGGVEAEASTWRLVHAILVYNAAIRAPSAVGPAGGRQALLSKPGDEQPALQVGVRASAATEIAARLNQPGLLADQLDQDAEAKPDDAEGDEADRRRRQAP